MSKILCIDSDGYYACVLRGYLERAGHAVLHASCGEQGMKDAGAERPDAIVLALRLSKGDGYTVLEELKAREDLRGTPVIILTELGGKEDVEQCMGCGAAAYLIKTQHTPEEIVECITRTIAR